MLQLVCLSWICNLSVWKEINDFHGDSSYAICVDKNGNDVPNKREVT